MAAWPFGKDGKVLKQARNAVAVAQRVSTLVAAESLVDALDVGLAAGPDRALLLRLLSSLDETARSLLQAMLETLATSTSDEHAARFGLWGHRAAGMVERMCQAYLSLLEEDDVAPDPGLLAQACFWLTQHALLRVLSGEEWEEAPWRLLLARLRGDAATLPDLGQQDPVLQQELRSLLFANLLLRQTLTRSQCFVATRLLAELAPRVALDNTYRRATPCIVLPDGNGLPRWLEGWQMTGQDGQALFCGFGAVLARLSELRAEFVAGTGIFVTAGAAPDERESADILAVFDLLHPLLDHPPITPPGTPGARRHTHAAFDFLRIRVLLASPLKQEPKREGLIRDTEILDISSEGVELLLESGSDCARVNGLLALYVDAGWWICIVRRLYAEDDGRLFVGAQRLARRALPARFLLLSGEERHVLGHVIYLPAQSRQRGLLLLAHMQVDLGADYTLDLERRENGVRIERLVEAGDGFVLLAVSFTD